MRSSEYKPLSIARMVAFIVVSVFWVNVPAFSATVISIGAGTAVTSADRTATFNSLIGSGMSLLGYTEDQILVSVADSYGSHDGRHYGDGGNLSYVSISASDGADIFAIEANVDDGWSQSVVTTFLWEARNDGVVTGGGSLGYYTTNDAFGSHVFGWHDLAGFDELRLAVYHLDPPVFGNHQAISLDDVSLQLIATNPIPLPAALPLFLSGLLGLGVMSRRRKRQARV